MQSTTRACLVLFLGCLLFHLVGTWFIPLIDRDEPRFAEASREMLERKDFVVPFFNDQYRFDKPPLTYWAQTVSYRIFGENDFAARFPSAVAAALVALGLFAWGRRIDGDTLSNVQSRLAGSRSGLEEREGECWCRADQTGWYSAIIFSLSFQVVEHAKAAVADMWLVLFVTLAHWAGWELVGSRKSEVGRRKYWWIFYISLAFGFLAKGPIAWTPLLTVPIFARLTSTPSLARQFKFVRGIILMLGIVCLWAVPALVRTNGDFFRIGIGRHVVERSFGVIGGHGASSAGLYFLLLPFYFVTIFLTFFPWSIKLPALATTLWRKRDATDLYLITGTLIVFGIFTFVTTRLVHYTLPAFPLLALLLARMIVRENLHRFFRRCLAITIPAYLVVALVIAPFSRAIAPARQLASDARGTLTPEMQFGAAEFQEPSLVWYFRKDVRSFMTPLHESDATAFMSRDGGRFIVLPTALAQDLWPSTPDDWKRYSAQGLNVAKGKRIDLTLLVKEK